MKKKTRMVDRPGYCKNDSLRKSGHGPVYVKDPKSGLTRSTFPCKCHGTPFESRAILSMHVNQYHKMVRENLEEAVATGKLPQKAWERLPGETPLQYRRFQTYLNSVSDKGTRSVDRTAAIVGSGGKNIVNMARKWRWLYRSQLWDLHIERVEMEEYERVKRRSAIRQSQLGQSLQQLAHAGAKSFLTNAARLDEMTGNEIAKLADVGTRIERLAHSDPTAISEDRGQVKLVWEGPRPAWAPEAPQIEARIGGDSAGDKI